MVVQPVCRRRVRHPDAAGAVRAGLRSWPSRHVDRRARDSRRRLRLGADPLGAMAQRDSLTPMPRVLLVTNDFPPRRGGIQSYLEELVNQLARVGSQAL